MTDSRGEVRGTETELDVTSPSGTSETMFGEPFWLDAVSPGRWSEVSLRDAQGRVTARLTYELRRRAGLTILQTPALTPYAGPFIPVDGGALRPARLGRELKYSQELAASLPRYDIAMLTMAPAMNAWVGFRRRGFRARPGLTYRLRLDVPAESLWKGVRAELRRDIGVARRHVTVHDELDPGALTGQVLSRLASKRVPHTFDENLFRRITDAVSFAGHLVWTLVARDRQGQARGAALLVGDGQCVYYLAGGVQPGTGGSVGGLLLWEGIQRAVGRTAEFDFEGSQIPGVEHFFRGFGGEQHVVMQVLRLNGKLAPLERLLQTRLLGQWP